MPELNFQTLSVLALHTVRTDDSPLQACALLRCCYWGLLYTCSNCRRTEVTLLLGFTDNCWHRGWKWVKLQAVKGICPMPVSACVLQALDAFCTIFPSCLTMNPFWQTPHTSPFFLMRGMQASPAEDF